MMTHSLRAQSGLSPVAISIALLLVNALVAAQPAPLTLDLALRLAREHNVRLKSAEGSVRAMKLSHDELMTTKLPQVQLEASALYAPSSGHFGYDPAISNGGQYAGQVIAKQSLYDGGVRSLRSDQIGVDIERVKTEFRMTERDLDFAVKQAFIEALRSGREINLQEESVRQLADYLQIVEQLSKGGNGSYTDVLKTKLQISDARLSYEKAVESHSTAKYVLAELLGGSLDTSFAVEGSLEDSTSEAFVRESADTTEALEMSAAMLAFQHSQIDIELARSERSPVVSVVGDAGILTSGDNLRLPYDERAGIFGFSLGLLLEVPLLSWGATDLRLQQKQLAADDVRFQAELLNRSLNSEKMKTRLHLKKLLERLTTMRANYASAEENFLLTKSKYAAGGTLSLEVLSAQQLLTDARLSELQTLADIRLLNARLEQLTAR